MTNAMLYYTVDVLWYLYDVTHPRMFPPYPGLGLWLWHPSKFHCKSQTKNCNGQEINENKTDITLSQIKPRHELNKVKLFDNLITS